MVKNNITVRSELLTNSSVIGSVISNYIADKFGVVNVAKSGFLENPKNLLNFDQKIDFLLGFDYFSIIDKSKLSVFKEIRKEFLNNPEVTSLEESFTSLDHNDDFLLILYPQQPFLPREEKLTVASYHLMQDVFELVYNFTNKIQKNKTFKSMLNIRYNTMKLSKFAIFLSIFMFK